MAAPARTSCSPPSVLPAPGQHTWDQGNNRKNIMRAIDASLKRLGTDYVDLYQIHFYDPNVHIDETLQAMHDLVRSGKVRYIGCSNTLAYQLARSIGRSELHGISRFESVQPRYNMLFREIERELLPLCAEENVAVIPYNPLAGGMLTGKHRPGAPTEGTRFTLGRAQGTYTERYWHDAMFDSVEQIRAIAEDAGVPMTTLAVQWVLANPAITSPIIGASRPEQLAASVGCRRLADRRRREGPPRRAHRRVPPGRPRPLSPTAAAYGDRFVSRHRPGSRSTP